MLFCNCLVFSRVKVIVAWLSTSSSPASYFIPKDQKQELHHQVGSLEVHQYNVVLGMPIVRNVSGRPNLSIQMELTAQELYYCLRFLKRRAKPSSTQNLEVGTKLFGHGMTTITGSKRLPHSILPSSQVFIQRNLISIS